MSGLGRAAGRAGRGCTLPDTKLPLALFTAFEVPGQLHALGQNEKHDFTFLVLGPEDQCGKPNGKGAETGQVGADCE